METQKGHNYLRCTKRIVRDCPQRYAREEIITQQIAKMLASVSMPDNWADWMIQELQGDRKNAHADPNKLLALGITQRLNTFMGMQANFSFSF